MEAKPKKKKKSGCLIAVIVLVLLGAVVAGGGNSSENENETTEPSEAVSEVVKTESEGKTQISEQETEAAKKTTEYKKGQYKIGKDMPAGVYMLIQQDYSWMAYFAITSDANGKDILKNDNFENSSIIEVVEGEYLEINRCSAFPIDEADVVGIMDGYCLAGAYIVGRHIPAGEYKVEADEGEMAYICIYPDTRRSKIESNDNFEGSRYVELKEGQLFEIKRGKILIGD